MLIALLAMAVMATALTVAVRRHRRLRRAEAARRAVVNTANRKYPAVDGLRYPMINGRRYSWASVDVEIDRNKYMGCSALSFGDVGESGGKCGSVTFYAMDALAMIAQLGDGWGTKEVSLAIHLIDDDMHPVSIILPVRFSGVHFSATESNDALVMRFDMTLTGPVNINGTTITPNATKPTMTPLPIGAVAVSDSVN